MASDCKEKVLDISIPEPRYCDLRFLSAPAIYYGRDCIDFRCPSWSTIERIQEHIDLVERVWCDREFRVIILYMEEANVLLAKLGGYFDV